MYASAVLVTVLCVTVFSTGLTIRIPAAEHLANYAGWPFRVFGRPQRMQQSQQSLPTLETDALHASVKFGENVVGKLERLEKTLAGADVRVRPGTPSHGQLIASNPHENALEKHRHAQVAIRASQHIADSQCRRLRLKERYCGELINTLSLEGTDLQSQCESTVEIICNTTSPYRNIDGTCNNINHPSWGRSMTAYKRMIPPKYGDGLYKLRKSHSASAPLPSPREISISLISDKDKPEKEVTAAVMQWAQFVGIDLAQTPSAKMIFTGSSISCCKPDGSNLPPRSVHPFCAPIAVPSDDPVFNDRQCLDYVRSVTAPRPDCKFGPAEQMNQATHWLDLSMVYGITKEISDKLRTHSNGHLATSPGPARPLMALSLEPTSDCQGTIKPIGPCFKSGDSRVNDQPMLTALQTVWVREHNRLADALHALNPQWGDETLFQEARRITIAEYQHITYDQWIPLLLGDLYSKQMGLQKSDYSESVNPAVRNSFSTAALQFLYSMIPGNISPERRSNTTLRLREHFNKPGVIQKQGILDQLLRMLATQSAQKVDLIHTEEVTHGFYAGELSNLGADALSIVVQRGRDHGLPGYNDFRSACGLPRMSCIDEFADLLPKTVVNLLKTLYANVNDVDLYVGAMAERLVDGALVGPTFRCLLGRQLRDTRKSDRFFYDLQGQAGSFTPEQLASIKKVTLARIFCNNGDDIKMMQPDVFYKPTTRGSLAANPKTASVTHCSELADLDLSPWREANQK